MTTTTTTPRQQAQPRTTAGRDVPHSDQAEQAFLGSILINHDTYFETLDAIQADDFYLHRHRFIYEAIKWLIDNHRAPDFVTVGERLQSLGQLAEVGGHAYLSNLINATPTAANAQGYAGIIVELAERRRLLLKARELANLAYDERRETSEAFTLAHDVLAGSRTSARETTGAGVLSRSLLSAIQERRDNPVDIPGLPTGISRDFDMAIGGLADPGLSAWFARPGHAKTAIALSILDYQARHGRRAMIFSREMSREKLGYRLLAARTRIPYTRIATGKVDDDEYAALVREMAALDELQDNLLINTDADTVERIVAEAMRWQADFVVIDHIGKIVPGAENARNPALAFQGAWDALKNLSERLKLHCMVLAHAKKDVEQRADKHPNSGDIWFCDGRDQDQIFGMMRPWIYDKSVHPSILDVQVLKSRDSEMAEDVLQIGFDAPTMYFSALPEVVK